MKGLEDATENTQRMAIPVEISLRRRLQWNEPVLDKLPEVGGARIFRKTEPENHFNLQVFRLLAAPVTLAPPFNPLPGAQHASLVADEACSLAQDDSLSVRSLCDLCMILGLTMF